MSDPIKEDDAKFQELLVKQFPTLHEFVESLPKSEDVIENDDIKMDDLLLLQSIANDGEIEYDSIEDKYEDEIAIAEVSKKLNEDIERFNLGEMEGEDGEEVDFDVFFDDDFDK